MDARREPRFSIYGPVKVVSLSSPERSLDCVLLDISATGLKLIAPEDLPVDDILALEAEDHLALADVRFTQPRGDKFTIGCERIHVLNKVALPEQKDKAEQIRLLIDDYRKRVRDGIATPRPDTNEAEAARLDRQLFEKCSPPQNAAPAQPQESPSTPKPHPNSASYATREQLLDAAVAWVIEDWDKIPPSPHDSPAARNEIVDRLSHHLAEKLHARTAPPAPAETAKKRAPEEQVPEKRNVRRWRLPIGLAIAAVLGWGLSGLFWSLGSRGAANHLPSSISSLLSSKAEPPAAPISSVRHAHIRIVEPTWLVVTADGNRLFNKKLPAGEIREIKFSDKAVLRVGNAKGVEITLDGNPIGPIGGRGQIRVVELNATGFRLLPAN